MIGHTIKKQQRPAALKKRIEKLKVQLQSLEALLEESATLPPETQGAQLSATPVVDTPPFIRLNGEVNPSSV